MSLPTDPYNLDPEFERAVLYLSCSNQSFWTRVGQKLDPRCMGEPQAKLMLETVHQVVRKVGRPPTSTIAMLQHLRGRVQEGKATIADVVACADLFDKAEDRGLPDEEDAVNAIVPVLRRRMQQSAVIKAHDEFSKGGDFSAVQLALHEAASLGKLTQISSAELNASVFDDIARVRNLDRLPSGIMELDLALDGGLARGELEVYLADSGGGKSIMLASQAAEGVRSGLCVCMATLELPRHVQFARIMSNLTGVPVLDILEVPEKRREAQRRWEIMAPQMGTCFVADFAPHATSVMEVASWIEASEQRTGKKVDLAVLDYGDKFHAPENKDATNEYVAMRYVYEAMRRDIAVKRNMWVHTASQASRGQGKNKRLDMHNVADSMHKVRVADKIITLNPSEDGEEMTFFVAKNRTGKSRIEVGPLPTDFSRARIVPATQEWQPW